MTSPKSVTAEPLMLTSLQRSTAVMELPSMQTAPSEIGAQLTGQTTRARNHMGAP